MGSTLSFSSTSSDEEEVDICPVPVTGESFHDKYELLRKLGKGKVGTVHAACFRQGAHLSVAVKITDLGAEAMEFRRAGFIDMKRAKCCKQEASLMRLVMDTRHVVRFVEAFLGGGCFHYIVMEKCEMSLWSALLQQQPLTEAVMQRYIGQMLQGLAAVHAVGMVHRDVKPDNFMCAWPGETVKLCDFDLASLLPAQDSAEAGLLGAFGTPPFMAPEMVRGNRYGTKVDTWSVGVITYILFFGHFPYLPMTPTAKAMKAAILGDVPPRFQVSVSLEQLPDLPPTSSEATSLARSLLQRVPRQRPSAEEALRLPFFQRPDSYEAPQGSLRPVLLAAKNAGAFEGRGQQALDKTEMDVQLALLQRAQLSPRTQHRRMEEGRVGRLTSLPRTGCCAARGGSSELEEAPTSWGDCA